MRLGNEKAIKYGSVITIQHVSERSGILLSDGYVDMNIYFSKPKRVPNQCLQRGLFIVFPPFTNETKKSTLDKLAELKMSKRDQKSRAEFIERSNETISTEYFANLKYLIKSYDDFIGCNTPFMLLHYASNKFLCSFDQESAIEKENRKLALTDFPGEDTLFFLSPIYKHQSDRDHYVFFGEEFYLTSHLRFLNEQLYLHISSVTFENRMAEELDTVQVKKKKNEKFEVNLSINEKHKFSFIKYDSLQGLQEHSLSYGNLIWFTNIENDTKLVAEPADGSEKIYDIQFYLPDSNSASPYEGLWQLENSEIDLGGFIKWGSKVRLKHYVSGNYLALKETYINDESKMSLTFSFFPSPETLFELEMIQRNINVHSLQSFRFIDSDATVYLKNCAAGLYIGCKTSNYTENDTVFNIKTATERNESIAMHLSRANNSEVSECNFLMSCRPFAQKYLRYLQEFDRLRQIETQVKPLDMLYLVMKLNNLNQNILDCLSILTKYTENQIMNENSRFNRDLISNRKKILNELDFIEMFAFILHYYYDAKDLQNIHKSNSILTKAGSSEGSMLAEDIDPAKDNASVKKTLSRHYMKYVQNGLIIVRETYRFLTSMVKKDSSNQAKLYEFLFCFQKHFAYFDESLILSMAMIEDNLILLNKLSETFFESLNIVKDQFAIKDKKRFFEVDISFKDKGQYMYSDYIVSSNPKDAKEAGDDFHRLANHKNGRPTSMIVYLLILLSRKIRKPLILEILSLCCKHKGGNFVPNQEKLTELFCENTELIKLFLSDLRMGRVKATRKLLHRYEEDENYLVIRPFFKEGKVTNTFHALRVSFLIQQINLYATLCSGRNLKWKQFLSELFPEEDLKNETIEPSYSAEFASCLWRFYFMLYIDREPLHDIAIPQMSKVVTVELGIIKLQDIFTLQSGKDDTKDTPEFQHMREVFLHLLDLCQARVQFLKEHSLESAARSAKEDIVERRGSGSTASINAVGNMPSQGNNALKQVSVKQSYHTDQTDSLLKDYYELLNRVLGFGVISFYRDFHVLTDLAKFSISSIQLNNTNPLLTYILECSRRLQEEEIKNRLNSWSTPSVKKFLDQKKAMKQKGFGEADIEDEEDLDFNIEDDKILQQHPLIRNCLLLQRAVLDATEHDAQAIKIESQIKVQACQILNRTLELRENFVLNKFITWFCSYLSKLQAEKPNMTIEELRKLVEQQLEAQADKLFPNVLSTAYREFDRSMEKESGSYGEGEGASEGEYIFDLDYLPIQRPGSRVQSLKSLPHSVTLPTLLYTFALAEDSQLQNNLLELILRCFDQRAALIRNLNGVNLFSTDDEIQIFTYFGTVIRDLRVQVQSSDTIIAPGLDLSDETLKGLRKFKELATNLSLGLLRGSKVTHSQMLLDTTVCQQVLSYDRQNMMRNLRLHEIIIDFLHKKGGLIEKIVESNSTTEYKKEVLSLFQECFSFLVFFIKNNVENQMALYSRLEDLLGNLKYEVGQIDLLCAIYQDNSYILSDLKNKNWVLQTFIKLIGQEGRQVRFLQFFECILSCQDESSIDNIYIILGMILPKYDPVDHKWTNIDILYLKVNKEKQLEFDLDLKIVRPLESNIEFLVNKERGETTYREQPFYYHAAIARIFRTVVKQTKKMDFFILKIKEVLSINYAFQIFCSEDGFTLNKVQIDEKEAVLLKDKVELKLAISYFKLQIVKLLYELFFKDSLLSTVDTSVFIKSFFFLMQFERYRFKVMTFQTRIMSYRTVYEKFESNHTLFASFLERFLNSQQFKDGLQNTELKENYLLIEAQIKGNINKVDELITHSESPFFHYFRYLILSVICYINNKKSTDINFKLENSEEGNEMKHLIKELANKRIVYSEKASPETMNDIKSFVKEYEPQMALGFDDPLVQDKAKANTPWKPSLILTVLDYLEIDKDFKLEKLSQTSNQAKSRNKTVNMQGKYIDPTQPVDWNPMQALKAVYPIIKDDDVTKRKILQEKLALAYAFLNFDKQLDRQKILQLGLASEKALEQTNLKKEDLIKKMIKYIEVQVGEKAAESNLKNLLEVFSLMIQESPVIDEIQDIFNNNHAMEMVMFLLSSKRPLPPSLLKSLMIFANAMLSEKNSQVQRGVFKHFRAFKQTEKTLSRFALMLSQATARAKESNTKKVISLSEENNDICKEILRFLCVCCEGHYSELQDYFRAQTNLSVQFNFLKEVVDLLSALSNNVYQMNYSLLILCFDALIEMIQGPNKANQDFLLKSSILEILSKFLMYSIPSERTRGRDPYTNSQLLYPNQVRKVKYKAIVLLQALCELIDSPDIVYNRLSKFFPIHLMLIYLEEAYKLYRESNATNQLINKALNQNVENAEKNPHLYLPIEGAFFLYFLMRIILRKGFYDKEIAGDYTTILLERIKFVKEVKSQNFLMIIFYNIWHVMKMVGLLFYDLYILLVIIFCRCRKNKKKNNAVAAQETFVNEDYNTLIMRLKNIKEVAFFTRFEEVLRFYDQNSASIEIDHSEKIYFLPFIYVPYFRYLPKEIKNEFNDTVDRSSRESKVRELIFAWDRFVNSAKYTYLVDKTIKQIHVLRVLYEYYDSVTLIDFMVAIAINTLILIAYSTKEDTQQLHEAINILAWISVGITGLIMLLIVIENIPEIKDYVARTVSLWEKIKNLIGLVVGSGLLYYILYLGSTFLGLYYHVFFHAFALSDCINRFPTMKIIFRAIYEPRKSLMLTIFLMLILCYVSALIWYSIMAPVLLRTAEIYPDYIPPLQPTSDPMEGPFPTPYQDPSPVPFADEPEPDDENPAQYCCVNMLLCFVCLIDNLIKNDAKIATTLAGSHFQRAYQMDYTIYAYDNIALIILKMLLLEILAGLIIDTFGALRDLDISKNEDLKGSCFICGLPVEEFEKPGCANFETHIAKEHYMWNYICYLGYLRDKDQNDYDGIEQYISRQMANNSISWIPNGKTLFLDQETSENIVFDNLERTDLSLEAMQTSLTRLRQIVTNIEQENIDRKKEKKRRKKTEDEYMMEEDKGLSPLKPQ